MLTVVSGGVKRGSGNLFEHFGVEERRRVERTEDDHGDARVIPSVPCPSCGWYVPKNDEIPCPLCGRTGAGEAQS